jgi:hypothetical protein
MTENSIFCADCGTKNEQSSIFCENCGKELKAAAAKPGKYSKLGDYQGEESFTPSMMSAPSIWNQGNLVNATINSYVKPDSTIPPLLEDANAPSMTPLVIIYALLSAILTYYTTLKSEYTFDDTVEQLQQDALAPGNIPALATVSAVIEFAGVFLIWYIGSWILASLLKGGMPMNSPLRMNASAAMRKLNAIRYFPSMIMVIVQIILVQLEDNQVFWMGTQNVQGTDTIVTETVTYFSPLFMTISFILYAIALMASLYVLYRGVKALGYQGGSLMMITLGLGLWGFYSAYVSYIVY